jgi:hypothetical protein
LLLYSDPFTNIFTLAREEDTSSEVIILHSLLNQINDDLGSLHDDVIQKAIGGEIEYEGTTVVLPDYLKRSINSLLYGESAENSQTKQS